MKYQPVGSPQNTIVAGAEFSAESGLLFMSMAEERKRVEENLQERREDKFFNSGFAMDVGTSEIKKSDTVLTDNQLDEMVSFNNGTWDNIIEDCYRWRESRSPESPLGRMKSASENANVKSEVNTLRFDTGKVRVVQLEEGEAIEVHIDENHSLTLFIDADNMEAYYDTGELDPISEDIKSLENRINQFNRLTIRNHSEAGIELMNAMKSDSIRRELSKTEIVLSHSVDRNSYIPEYRIIDDDREIIDKDVATLRGLSPLPNEETKRKILQTLGRGYNICETRIKLVLLLEDEQRMTIPYSYLSKPYYIEEIGRLLGKNIVSIPQESMILFTEEAIPDWIQELDEEFPEKNRLDDREKNRIMDYVNYPSFLDITQNWQKSLKSKEILLSLYEQNEVSHSDIVSYYLVPWDFVTPSEDKVRMAIDYGYKIREILERMDIRYETDLYDSTVIWEKRKIYRRSNYERD
jgi:hypothetical protein